MNHHKFGRRDNYGGLLYETETTEKTMLATVLVTVVLSLVLASMGVI